MTVETPILCIDPGQHTHGIVLFNPVKGHAPVILRADGAASARAVRAAIYRAKIVLVERVAAQGIGGRAVIETAEHSAAFVAAAQENGRWCAWMYRRDICRALDVRGKAKDRGIRARLEETWPIPPGSARNLWDKGRKCPKRNNKSHDGGCPICHGSGWEHEPGPLSAVTSHAIQALALWPAWQEMGRPIGRVRWVAETRRYVGGEDDR